MSVSRRALLKNLAYGVGATSCGSTLSVLAASVPPAAGWTDAWDVALLRAEIAHKSRSFDKLEQMMRAHRGPDYHYSTNIRSATVHPTRDSLEYASLLLYDPEPASTDRAIAILERVLPLQVQDPGSPYFGLWSYYLEEPVEKMGSVDFNWADFNGATLLNILYVHEKRLPSYMAKAVRIAVRNAAACIRKRNVSLYYSNIAFQGTYVTLADGELLGDASMLDYARQRFERLADIVDKSGSFSEYNSPTYMAVTIENISRILMYVRDPGSRAIAEKLNSLAWKHIAEHWHAPTKQLAGPMSRAYSNDIKSPMWIQKGTDNHVKFVTLDDLAAAAPEGEASVATVDFRCPRELLPLFASTPRHQHREVFIAGTTLVDNLDVSRRAVPVAPIEGTTLLTPSFTLGSANRSDFWIQRRPLIAYWGDATRPPKCLQLRVVKDDYDFSSALFYSAQNQGSVAGSIRFRSDGGDKHPSLDRIKNGTFSLSELRVELLFENWQAANRILIDSKAVADQSFTVPVASRIAIEAAGVKIFFQARYAHFIAPASELRFDKTRSDVRISVALLKANSAQTVHWADLSSAGCDFTLWMDDSAASLEKLDSAFAAMNFKESASQEQREMAWSSKDGVLTVKTAARVLPVEKMDEMYEARIDGKPFPFVRLDDAPDRY